MKSPPMKRTYSLSKLTVMFRKATEARQQPLYEMVDLDTRVNNAVSYNSKVIQEREEVFNQAESVMNEIN